jgi:hypothetical protein
MGVLYIEGVAIHGGPEPCVGLSRGGRRSVGRGRAGWAIEPRNHQVGVPTLYKRAEGNIAGGVIARRQWTPRGQRTRACTKVSMRENREVWISPGLVDTGFLGGLGRRV